VKSKQLNPLTVSFLVLVLAVAAVSYPSAAQTHSLTVGSHGSGPTQIIGPYGVALDAAGNIYVVDNGNHRVQKYDSLGNHVMTIGPAGSGWSFNSPHGIMVDDTGTIYVSNHGSNQILWFSPAGALLGQYNMYSPYGMVKDSAGNMLVCGWAGNEVIKFDPSWNVIFQIYRMGTRSRWFYLPGGVGVDSADNIYVADTYEHIIRKFDSQGNHLLSYGSYQQAGSADGQFARPHGIAVDHTGNTYVADTDNGRVQAFDSQGAFQWKITGLNGPSAVAVSGSSILAVAEHGANQVRIYNLPLQIATEELPDAVVGRPFSHQLDVVGGSPPYTFSVSSGALPPGLVLSTGGELSGTPTQSGTFIFTVQVTDALQATDTQACSLHVGACAPVPSGLVSWWPGDGTAEDIKGENHGTLQNGASYAPGMVGQAFQLDGVDDYISVPDHSSLNAIANGFTIDAWIKRAPDLGWVAAVVKKAGNGGGYTLEFNEGTHIRFIAAQATPGFYVSPDVWTHVAGVYTGSQLLLYVNGTQVGSTPAVNNPVPSSNPLWIGNDPANPNDSARRFKGLIDEVDFFDRALSAAEIQAIHAAGSAGKCRGETDPPVVTITSPADGTVVGNPAVYVTVDVIDASATTVTSTPAGVGGSLSAGGGSVNGTVTLTGGDGPHDITVSATDAFENTGGTSITLILDTTPPSVTVTSPPENAVLGESPAAFSVTVVDDTATSVRFGLNSIPLSPGGGTATGEVALSEGANAVDVTVTDAADNQTLIRRNVVLDLSAPVVTITSPVGGTCFGPGSQPVPITATIDDLTATTVSSTPAGVSGSLPPGGGLASGAVNLVEGVNTLTVSATDATSRTGSNSITVILDTTAPAVAVTSPAAGDQVNGEIDFHATAVDPGPGSGVAQVVFLVDNQPVNTLTAGPWEMILDTRTLIDGSHTLEVEATDGKGNRNTAIITVNVDNTPPAVTITCPAANALVGGTIPFTVSASDAGSGLVEVTQLVGGQPPTGDQSRTFDPPVSSDVLSGQEDLTRWPDGPLTFSARAVDMAGNVFEVTAEVTVDNTIPAEPRLSPRDGRRVRRTIPIRVISRDPNLESIEIKVGDLSLGTSSTSPFRVLFDTTTRLDGAMVIQAIVTGTNNLSATTAHTVTVDNIRFRCLTPRLLNLRSNRTGRSVIARLEGKSVGLLIPTENHQIELRVPGGNPVPASTGWSGDDQTVNPDHDNVPDLLIKFDRSRLIASILAGIDAGKISRHTRLVKVELWVNGERYGCTRIFIIGRRRGGC